MGSDLLDLKIIMPDDAQEKASQSGDLYDLIIIGGGPAAMTSAVYAARKQIKTMLISKDLGGQLLLTASIENYMGYNYITGKELTDKFKTQMEQFPIVDIILGNGVEKLTRREGMFVAKASNGREYLSRTVIIASGKRSKPLNAKGENRLAGHGISYCATCDAPLFKDRDVAVIGGGNSGAEATIELMGIANKIYLINRSVPLKADPILIKQIEDVEKVTKLLPYIVTEIKGDDAVSSIVVESKETGDKKEIQVQGVFVEIGLIPNSEFACGLVQCNQWNEILVDCACLTNIPGVFAAGDVTTVPEKQIGVAVGEGTKAALSAYKYLLMNPQEGS